MFHTFPKVWKWLEFELDHNDISVFHVVFPSPTKPSIFPDSFVKGIRQSPLPPPQLSVKLKNDLAFLINDSKQV